jgi:hypothetical protein
MWLPAPGAADRPGAVEDAEVLGDVLVGRADGVLRLGDGGVALAQAVEELDPHGFALGEGLESALDGVC